MHFALHILGIACLVIMAGSAVYAMWEAIAPRRAQITIAMAPLMPSYTNAYQAAVYGRRRKVAALIALVLVCAASLYRGGFA